MLEMMKSKNFLILLLFIVATSISIWLVSMPTPNIRNIVTETHKQISHLKDNMNAMAINNGKDLSVDETYLELLGFTKNPHLYPENVDSLANVPVVVTGVTSRNYENAFTLIESVRRYLTNKQMVIFDLGLGSYELVTLKKHCNETTSCMVRSFDFDKFPRHLRDMDIKAFKPVAIQEALNEYGALLWTDAEDNFITSDIGDIIANAKKIGIAAWTIESAEPTSALTHPKMFAYFKTRQDLYYFHRMVDSGHLVIFNTASIHSNLMLPWVKCALTVECIWPTGAQNVGCNFHRKPLFRYSGCHKYDISALNVILGIMFNFDDSKYTIKKKIFGIEEVEEYETTTVKNSTRRSR